MNSQTARRVPKRLTASPQTRLYRAIAQAFRCAPLAGAALTTPFALAAEPEIITGSGADVTRTNQGAAGRDGTPSSSGDGGAASSGAAATDFTVELAGTAQIIGTGITLRAGGGAGGIGGSTTADHHDGGPGGLGGGGGRLSLSLRTGSKVQRSFDAGAISLISSGGHGGDGGDRSHTFGKGGAPGAGGVGGSIVYLQDAGAGVYSLALGTTAITLSSLGGDGPDAIGAITSGDPAQANPGGAGGAGGIVWGVDNPLIANRGISGTIASAGSAVLATSKGGNGGNGGTAEGASGAGIAKGGTGGAGGNGGEVRLVVGVAPTTISATGDSSRTRGDIVPIGGGASAQLSTPTAAVAALSRGGIGGTGGTSNGLINADAGDGGAAGAGGLVSLFDTGATVSTTGYGAAGLLVQSIGGVAGSGNSAQSFFSARGGKGGAGGQAGNATVFLAASPGASNAVITTGEDADGIVAQSLGGGGGWGGDARVIGVGVAVGIGGLGGAGGDSGGILVNNGDGVVSTHGASANGIVAQAIAGGGGRGGDASAVSLGGTLALSVGGAGGSGGRSHTVVVEQGGVIQTQGEHAIGVIAQSIGGGGGAGGGANSLAAGGVLTVAVAVGGAGNSGGISDAVTVKNTGQIATGGTDAFGVLAQSISGGGGHGGGSVASAYQLGSPPDIPSLDVKVSVGGDGGPAPELGNAAGAVAVDNQGTIFTTGGGATGVVAQSLAGGGGAGGDSGAFGQTLMTSTINVTTSIGGKGGAGGASGKVTVANEGFIGTLSRDAVGILAQSISGGGGNGGFGESNSGTFSPDDEKKSLQLTVTVGGRGGAGGPSGEVDVTNAGGILTLGDNAHGIAAQSISGGGGNGGAAIAGATGGSVNVNIAVGGTGGGASVGGKVGVVNTGSIMTTGGQSHAILAQSVGGGGGTGGNAATSGGQAAETSAFDYIGQGMGIGADVVKNADGVYSLVGNFVPDLKVLDKLKEVASNYVAGEPKPAPSPSRPSTNHWKLDVGGGVAGAGGLGNDGGEVHVDNHGGALLTQGAGASGILAQSIGGGGGSGGLANGSTTDALFLSDDPAGAFSVGGAGGIGGNGGLVTVSSTGNIDTTGDAAFAIHAQSIGGGGGTGGLSMSQVGTVKDLSVSLGGHGGASGNGGEVHVDIEPGAVGAHTVTSARDASAIVAQSIGAGGGLGVLYGVQADGDGGRGKSHTGALSLPNFSLTLNNTGGANGNGGAVTVDLGKTSSNFGYVSTTGIDAYGVLAQSIGGGGGLFLGGQYTTSNDGADALNALYAKGRGTGHGGAVTVTVGNGFNVATAGDGGVGILAQSIGGGGGLIGGMHNVYLAEPVHANNVTRNDGQGGDVSVSVGGRAVVATQGANAPAILAQSLGGGGGVLEQDDGRGFAFANANRFLLCGTTQEIACTGRVAVTVDGGALVETRGAKSYTIAAQSHGNGINAASVTVGPDAIVRSIGASMAAIRLDATDQNTLVVQAGGTVERRTADGQLQPDSIAVIAPHGSTIDNAGTIVGAVITGAGSTLRNSATGRLSAGGTLDLGAGSRFENAGTVDVAGKGFGTLRVRGDYTQTASGRLVVDVDTRHHRAEVLSVDGNARLAGTIAIRPSTLSPDPVVVVKTENGSPVALDQLTVVGAGGSGAFTYSSATTGEGLSVTPHANMQGAAAAQGFGATRRSAAAHLESGFNADLSESQSRIFATLANLDSAQAYGKALDSVSGQVLQTVALSRRTASVAFSERLNASNCGSAPALGELAAERDCAWSRASTGNLKRRAHSDGIGYDGSLHAAQVGWQRRLGNGYSLAAGVSVEHDDVSADDGGGSVRGNAGSVAATLKKELDRVALSVGIDVGHGRFSSQRRIAFGDVQEAATGRFGMWHAGLHGRIAYLVPQDGWYLKPYLDGHAVQVRTGAFREQGNGDLSLDVDSGRNTLYGVSPMLEIGGKRPLRDGWALRGHVGVGALLLHDRDSGVDARLTGWQNGSTTPLRSSVTVPQTQGKANLGIAVAGKNAQLSLDYSTEFASRYLLQSASIKLDYRF